MRSKRSKIYSKDAKRKIAKKYILFSNTEMELANKSTALSSKP